MYLSESSISGGAERFESSSPHHSHPRNSGQLGRRVARRIRAGRGLTRLLSALASLPLLVALGCGDGTTIEIPGTECRERCVDGRIYDLSSIDHEQPSVAAIEAIDRSCRETSEPCCFHVGAGPFSGKMNGFVTCLPSRESAE